MDVFGVFSGILAFVMSLLPMIVIIAVLTRVSKLSRAQRGRNTQGDPNAWLQQQQSVQRQSAQPRGKLVKPLMPAASGRSKASPKAEAGGSLAETFMKDDREHDWLARQMREEAKILRRGDMMDLGASHAASCDAEMLKKYHLYAEHDDSVDNGEY